MNLVAVSAVLLTMVIKTIAVRSATNRCNCASVYQPVCGVDGVTYDNTCKLACEQVRLYYVGECDGRISGSLSKSLGRCACPTTFEPVCGQDGNTYNNLCLAACAGVQVKHKKECRVENDNPCKCPPVYQPVCGYDGNTYDNICELACEGLRLRYMGVCGDRTGGSMNRVVGKCACPSTYDPICGKDGNTYSNACFMICAGVQQEHQGECHVVRNEQYCKCPAFYRPVCGLDNITYNNACFLLCAGVALNYTGTCKMNRYTYVRNSDVKDVCSCPAAYEPACGADENTYRNRCFMTCAGVKLEHMGECNAPKCNDRCHCPTIYQPVCGGNHVTYRNTCCMMCANISLAHAGPC